MVSGVVDRYVELLVLNQVTVEALNITDIPSS